MTKKLTTELVEQAAKQTGIPDDQRLALIQMLAHMTTDEADEEKPPAVKKQFVFMLADPTGRFTPEFIESSGLGALTGWVAQIPEQDSPHSAPARVIEAAHIFNCTKRGRLIPVQTFGEACENIPSKILKEQSVWVKTKCPIYALPVANELPDTPSVLGNDRGSHRAAA
jgi:hypothetical protein